MNLLDLQHIERAYDKAKMAGPQALHDWATSHAPALFERLRPELDGSKADPLAPLRPLYPGVTDDLRLLVSARDDIAALRAERARLKGTASDDPAHDAPAFNYGDPRRIVDALRPFAAFGAPPVLAALDAAREFIGAGEETPVFAVIDSDGATAIASVTREQCIAAHDLINEIDGGTGA